MVVAEHNGDKLLPTTRNAITAAKKIGGDITVLVAGPKCAGAAKEAAAIGGVKKLLVSESADYNGFVAERLEPLVLAAQDQFKFTHIVSGASAFSRALLPRVAAKLDVSPISEVTDILVREKAKP